MVFHVASIRREILTYQSSKYQKKNYQKEEY
jgi:hypothetical protein